MDRKAFLDQEPPPGYVAGIGRGATGFTTSADTARVRFESVYGNEDNSNEVGDSDEGILSKAFNRTNEDEEADRIYEEIDLRLQRKPHQIKEVESGVVEIEAGNGIIKKEFSLYKRELASVSMDEWANLPDVGDITRRNKRQRILNQQVQRTYAAPDMLIASAGQALNQGLLQTTHELASKNSSSVKIADIEQWEESFGKVANVEKSRLIFASLRRTEPYKADSWIASARLEEQAKNFDSAKSLIQEGCTKLPHNAAIWEESIRIHRKSEEGIKRCKALLSEALRLNSGSEKLWLLGVDLESPADTVSKKKILMRALEYLPGSSTLWKSLVDLEEGATEKVMLLKRATDICLHDWDLWLNLINLSTYVEAKAALNKVRRHLPKEHKVWITALKLEERENPNVPVLKLVLMLKKGIAELQKNDATCDIESWLNESSEAEAEDFDRTCQALVECACLFVPDVDKLATLILYAEERSGRTSLYIYQQIVKENPHDIGSWVRLLNSLRLIKKEEDLLYKFYEQAVKLNPEVELFPLMFAKDKWIVSNDVKNARRILKDGSRELPRSEKIWLARVKLEVKCSNYKNAYQILKEALTDNEELSPKLWYEFIHLIRFCLSRSMDFVSSEELFRLSATAIDIFPEYVKLYLQRSQLLVDFNDAKAAREALLVGSRKCPSCVEIWCALADIDIGLGAVARVRSLLDTAILKIPDSDILWQKKISLEIDQRDMISARQLISKCLKQFPTSPNIWLQNLSTIQKPSHRRNAFLDALRLTNNNTQILLGIGVFFWMEGKFMKAKTWFDRATSADSRNGDAWSWSYCFACKNGIEAEKEQVLNMLINRYDEIDRGDVWHSVVEDHRNLDKSPSQVIELVSQKLLESTI